MPSFSTSLSGLNANSEALSVIANNLANLNTVAYKGSNANFSDLFYQQVGTTGQGNPIQIGVGSTISSITSPFTQGNINGTGVSTDVAIQQDGFFMIDKDGMTLYTRAGNFSKDENGSLVTDDGGFVLGYPAVNGTISPAQTLAPLSLSSGRVIPANATTNFQIAMNLDASAALPAQAVGTLTVTANPANNESVTIGGTTYVFKTALSAGPAVANEILIGGTPDATLANLKGAINHETTGGQTEGTTYSTGTVANASASATASTASSLSLQAITGGVSGNTIPTTSTMANGSFGLGTLAGGAPGAPYSTTLVTNDSLGTSHVLTFSFNKTAAGTWDYQITIPGADVGQANPLTVGTGTLQFDGAGKLISPAANVAGLAVNNLADGASPLNLTWQIFDPTGTSNITQVAGPSAVSTTQQDGYPSGTLQSFSIGSDGVISGVLSNGQTTTLGQIALANFPNIQGLTRAGANNFLASLSSGLPNVGAPGTGGRGTLKGGALEQSNVDIATQFTQLILAERGYQANSRAITTADEITQDAINLKR